MMPLSQKTLEKKYAELGLSDKMIALLHDYYSSFANLYGVLFLRDAWDVFEHYEGLRKLHKKDFIAFSGIVQREEGNPYAILELKEVYTGETSDNPVDRLIVHKDMIRTGLGKYGLLYDTEEHQAGKPLYLPEDREELFLYKEDQFYLTPDGKAMVKFLSNLRTDGQFRNFDGEPYAEILDIDGKPVIGKKLSEFVFYTQDEQFDIDYYKAESKKKRMREEYRTTALDKILYRIRIYIQTGGYYKANMADMMDSLLKFIQRDLGVPLRRHQVETFVELFTNLNNDSHLWLNCGWSPSGLSDHYGRRVPDSISIGPNMQKMIENGEIDRDEFESRLKAIGINLIDAQ